MQIDPNIRTSSAAGINPINSPATPAPKLEVDADFHDAEALNHSLQNLEEVRADKIEKALNLLGQVEWPAGDTIRRISHLLAVKIQTPEE